MKRVSQDRRSSRWARPERWRALFGLLDQAVVSVASAGTALLGITLLAPDDAGSLVLSLAFLYFAQGVGRAVVGQTMLAHVPRLPGSQQPRELANGQAAALSFGGVASLALLIIWFLRSSSALNEMVWCAFIAPIILLGDACRSSLQTSQQQGRALAMDTLGVLVQGALVVLFVLRGEVSGGGLITSWGAGAAVSVATYFVRSRVSPLAGHPVEWVRATRHLFGWLTACAVLGQVQTLLTANLLAGLLSRSSLAVMRFVQILILQPVGNFSLALNGLVLPRVSAIAAENDVVRLKRSTRNVAFVTLAVGGLVFLMAVLFVGPTLEWYRQGDFAVAADLAVPVGLQAWIYMAQVPFGIAILSLQRANLTFYVYVAFVVFTLLGLYLGARQSGLEGAAYGLTVGAAATLAVEIWMYVLAVRQAERAGGHENASMHRQYGLLDRL